MKRLCWPAADLVDTTINARRQPRRRARSRKDLEHGTTKVPDPSAAWAMSPIHRHIRTAPSAQVSAREQQNPVKHASRGGGQGGK